MGIVTESGDKPVVRRVAVVGVHGIARHPAGETEDAMADLLLSLPGQGGTSFDGARRYEPFKAVGIQIPLQRVLVEPPPAEPVGAKKGRFKERSTEFADGLRARKGNADPGNQYTKLLLEKYLGGADSNVYRTTRLEGRRSGAGDAKASKVDIYEVLWADLAHPDSSLVGFFLSFFSLLLHLGSLSRLVLDSGAGENPGKQWKAYCRVQSWAVNFLQIFVPLFKVLLLVVVLGAIPGVLPAFQSNPELAGVAAGGLGLLLGIGLGIFRFSARGWGSGRSPWLWAALVMAPGAVVALAFWGLAAIPKVGPVVASSISVWIVVGAPLVGFVLSKYEEYRKGAQISGWTALVLSFVGYVSLLYLSVRDVTRASFWLAEFLVAAIRLSWLSMSVLAIVALLMGSLAWRLERDRSRKARKHAAVRTSRLALAIPAVSLLLVVPLVWAALIWLSDKLFGHGRFFKVDEGWNSGLGTVGQFLTQAQLIPDIADAGVRADYFRSALAWGMGYQLPITLALVAMGTFLLAFWALPSALLEKFPERDEKEPPRSSTNAQSLGLGRWLSRGLDGTAVVTWLLWGAFFPSYLVVYLLRLWDPCWLLTFKEITHWIVDNPLSVVGGSAVVALAKYGSSALETVLDVDTYLRTSPKDASPRAKIFERYVSTLRYVAAYRDAEGSGYDSVVIVAHSLGSLISADLLRFLYSQKDDPTLDRFAFGKKGGDKIPVTLLTMGSPIRQLLNRLFPYLYDWVRKCPDNGLEPLPDAKTDPNDPPTVIADAATPDPTTLGLARWVNLYRSGDYVGRSLWLDEWYMRPGEAPGGSPAKARSYDGLREEMCIGAGAHTHYWDDTAPDVAEVLDEMIRS